MRKERKREGQKQEKYYGLFTGERESTLRIELRSEKLK